MARNRLNGVHRWQVVLVGVALFAAACGGGGTDDEQVAPEPAPAEDGDAATADDADTTTADEPEAEAGSDDGETDEDAESDDAAPTVTEPTRPSVAGDRWTSTVILEDARGVGTSTQFVEVGDELWIIGGRYNGSYALRSTDDGLTWESVAFEPPPGDGASTVSGLIQGPGGRLVAWGLVADRCGGFEPAPIEGFRRQGVCQGLAPSIHISDDGGATFRRLQPGALQPPSGSAQVLGSIAATPDGYVAIGTLRNADWRGRVWTSPDAENWTLATELRGADGPVSLEEVAVADDGTIVVLGFEAPCSEPREGSPGWFLGSQWAEHARIYTGADAQSLARVDASVMPLAPETAAVDCSTQSGGDVDRDIDYPGLGLVVADSIPTFVDFTRVPDPADGEADVATRYSQLIDGVWTAATEIAVGRGAIGLQGFSASTSSQVLTPVTATDGELRFARHSLRGSAQVEVAVFAAEAERARSEPRLIASRLHDVIGRNGELLAVGVLEGRPFDMFAAAPDESLELILWRSMDDMPPPEPCVLEPGAACASTDLTAHPDYPNFQGLDLAGIDLAFATLGAADFSGSDLSGALLWGVGDFRESPTFADADLTGAELPDAIVRSFDGADLTGALAEGVRVETAVGADFTDANLVQTTIEDATGATFRGAEMSFTTLEFTDFPSPDAFEPGQLDRSELVYIIPDDVVTVDLSLAGWDLTGVEISGSQFDGTQFVRITDLTGATLDRTRFSAVDLSALPTVPDLGNVTVWDNSICPDGLPPDDGPIGTCVRGG